MNSNNDDKYILSSLNNALDVLNTLATQPDMGITELSTKLQMGKSSVFKALYTLEKKGFVKKVADSRYALGMQLAILGKIVTNQSDDFKIIHYILESIALKTNMTVYLSVLSKDFNIVFLDRAHGNAMLQFRAKQGSKYPAYCTGGGKVLLSYLLGTEKEKELHKIQLFPRTRNTITDYNELYKTLENIRKQGYGVDNGEGEIELLCFGVPVIDNEGKCVCSLSISGPRQTMSDNKEEFLAILKEGTKNLQSCMDLLIQYISLYPIN